MFLFYDGDLSMFAYNMLPGYKTLSQILTQQRFALTPAELHGLISGLLCGAIHGEVRVQAYVRDLANDGEAFTPPLLEVINTISGCVSSALTGGGFLFDVLLPDRREVTVLEQTDALVDWVSYFLLGLGTAQPKIDTLEGDPAEALRDLRFIGRHDHKDRAQKNVFSMSLPNLVEYVRLSAVLYHDTFCYSLQFPYDGRRRILH